MQVADAFVRAELCIDLTHRRGKLVEAQSQIEVRMTRSCVACPAGRDSLVSSSASVIYLFRFHGLGVAS